MNTLLGKNRLKRMIESTLEDAIKVLSEVNFGEGRVLESPLEFEKLLYVEERKLLRFIRATCSSETFKRYFLLKYDYHNIETLIKSKYLKFDPEKMLVCHGNYESAYLSERIMTDTYKSLSKYMQKALLECDLLFVNNKANGENVSSTIKKAMFEEMSELAKNEKYIKDIFSFSADMQNVSICLRTRDFSIAKELFVVGGNLTINELKNICAKSVDELKEIVKFYKNGSYIATAIEEFSNGKPLSEFERMVDSFAIDYLGKLKYSNDGIIPFILYCYYKIAEIKNVRIVLVGLINNMGKSEIERRLRDTYEG